MVLEVHLWQGDAALYGYCGGDDGDHFYEESRLFRAGENIHDHWPGWVEEHLMGLMELLPAPFRVEIRAGWLGLGDGESDVLLHFLCELVPRVTVVKSVCARVVVPRPERFDETQIAQGACMTWKLVPWADRG
jgi:hypothetical protein